jgi:hypothetical protein
LKLNDQVEDPVETLEAQIRRIFPQPGDSVATLKRMRSLAAQLCAAAENAESSDSTSDDRGPRASDAVALAERRRLFQHMYERKEELAEVLEEKDADPEVVNGSEFARGMALENIEEEDNVEVCLTGQTSYGYETS